MVLRVNSASFTLPALKFGSTFTVVVLDPRTNPEMVPKFHIALPPSRADLPCLKIEYLGLGKCWTIVSKGDIMSVFLQTQSRNFMDKM
jgi:hypothetical protein